MAEALARSHASDVIAPASAGITPVGHIAHEVQFVLLQRGILMTGHYCKSIGHPALATPQLYINMSGIAGEQLFAGSSFEDWDVAAPVEGNSESFQRICDDIEARVLDLAARLRVLHPDG